MYSAPRWRMIRANRPAARAADFVPFAWQGFQLQVPSDWDLSAASGDYDTGYCRLDDETMPRLEIKWRGGLRTKGASSLTDRFLKDARLNRKGSPVRIKRDTALAEVPDADCECFFTCGETDAVHMAVCCSVCGRASMLRVIQRPGDTSHAIARRILQSFRDHPSDDWMPWAILGFSLATPKEFRLKNHRFEAGRLQMDFAARRRSASAVRLGLARTALRGTTLLDWARRDPLGVWPGKRLAFELSEHQGRPAVLVSGARRRLLRRRAMRGIVWLCEEENALYLATWQSHPRDLNLFQRFADSFELPYPE